MANLLSSISPFHSALVTGAVAAGIGSGMLYVFSTGVMAGLGQLNEDEAVRAMQAINEAAISPLFLGVFLGTGVFLLLLAGHHLRNASTKNPWLLAGAGVYAVGVVAVTVGAHLPLNDALAAVDPSTMQADVWHRYAKPWLMWNHVRAFAAAVSSALLAVAALA